MVAITDKDIERDYAQTQCWNKTIKALTKLFEKSDLWVAEYLLGLSKERFNETLILYGGEWGKRLEELGGAK
jgi:hypothetical protein